VGNMNLGEIDKDTEDTLMVLPFWC
jgi:hypothetical protein